MSFPYTRDDVKAWLTSMLPESSAGQACDSGDCPLANFLRTSGAEEVEVTRDAVTFDGQTCAPPKWARDFIEAIDQYEAGFATTARKALVILESIND